MDVRVDRSPTHAGPPAVGTEQRRGRDHDRQQERQADEEPRGTEELAVALHRSGRRMVAHLEFDAEGQAVVRIVDRERGETVALLTPDELRAMAEQTGLPAGLLLQIAT